MKRYTLLAVALLMIAAGPTSHPATHPTTQPDKPVAFADLIRETPRELRPPRNQKATRVEVEAIEKWVANRLRGKRITFTSSTFDFEEKNKGEATLSLDDASIDGAMWNLHATAAMTAPAVEKINKKRERKNWVISGTVTTVRSDSSATGDQPWFEFRVTMADTDVR